MDMFYLGVILFSVSLFSVSLFIDWLREKAIIKKNMFSRWILLIIDVLISIALFGLVIISFGKAVIMLFTLSISGGIVAGIIFILSILSSIYLFSNFENKKITNFIKGFSILISTIFIIISLPSIIYYVIVGEYLNGIFLSFLVFAFFFIDKKTKINEEATV